MHHQFTIALWLLLVSIGLAADPAVNGNATIRGKAGSSEIVITTTDRLAGAIDSLKWNGKEFIDSHDHGRQLQSACAFDCATGKEFWAECFNPTEAGSRDDGTGDKSTSKLLSLHAEGAKLETKVQMAFWLKPGEDSSGRPALNGEKLSKHLVSKKVQIGYKNLEHVLEYTVRFEIPKGERHNFAQFEALTGYMPPEFSRFYKFIASSGKLEPIDAGPGEQDCPLVFATESSGHAMGIYSPDQPSRGFEKAGYGRWNFKAEKVVKWNCVFRSRNDKGIEPGERSFRLFVAVGSLQDVRKAMESLKNEFATK